MIPLPEVQASVMRSITRFAPVEFARADALGLVLAADVVAGDRVPPFDNTAMDGYAVRAADTEGARADAPVRLRVVGELPAGHAPTVAVGRGKAVRIMTGAPIPEGADAIVIVETTERVGEAGDAVDVFQAAAVGCSRASTCTR
jgi:molybdopterin biosynthesis enzyme